MARFLFLSDEEPTLETLDFSFYMYISSTPTFHIQIILITIGNSQGWPIQWGVGGVIAIGGPLFRKLYTL